MSSGEARLTPTLHGTRLSSHADPSRPLLILGPSLGTSAETLWGPCARQLDDEFHVVGWDLPGHGRSSPATGTFRAAELAAGVLRLAERVLVERGQPSGRFCYAGDSLGGAVGLQLLLDHPGRIAAAILLCTGARIGAADGWGQRAELVRTSGTHAVAEGSATRWFAPGFIAQEPDLAAALLQNLDDADPADYAMVCALLADFDVTDRLGEISTPVLAVAGGHDQVNPIEDLRHIADGVQDGTLRVLDDVAHLAPAEAPVAVARLILEHCRSAMRLTEVRAAGMAARRAVLGNEHVDVSTALATDFTQDFQDFITQYAWGSIWTRPGLDRRTRSLITLTALVARGHHDELAMHVRAARTNGVTDDELKELFLQTAIYCGVPDANTAFRIAQHVLTELDETPDVGTTS